MFVVIIWQKMKSWSEMISFIFIFTASWMNTQTYSYYIIILCKQQADNAA